ncbi:MAG: hypothetical protein E7584_07295 [Ruminococcaceae bacterium]|nr:hypothetical protein [Oscillospiraceae bacterium]
MNKPNKMSRKGWKLYSSGNVVATWSSVFIGILLAVTIGLLIPVASTLPNSIEAADIEQIKSTMSVLMYCLLVIIVLSALALLFVLIGKLLFWKGITYLLGALQMPETITPVEYYELLQSTPQQENIVD